MNKAGIIGMIIFLVGIVPTLMLFASHIAYSIYREEIILGTTLIVNRYIDRLFLAPAYLAVAFYFIGGALSGVDMFKSGECSKESRLIVHIAATVANIIFLVSCGAAIMANFLMLPDLAGSPVLGLPSTLVVDTVGLLLMGPCYIAFFFFWFAAINDKKSEK